MNLIILENTFGTVAEMDTYFTNLQYINTDFTNLIDKQAYLFDSYIEMNSFCDQNSYAYYYFDSTIVPTYIKYAQFELIKNMLVSGTTSSEPEQILKSLKAGSAQLVFENDMQDKKNPLQTERVKGMLRKQCKFNEPGGFTTNIVGT